MVLQIKIAGILMIILALMHVVFPKYFNWKTELKSLSLINKEIMLVHTFFIALIVFLIGLLCLTSANELIGTSFGKRISLGIGIFWGIRLLVQFFGYSSALWKGKKLETTIHIIFSILWIYFTSIFFKIYFAI
jgi:hypothetical protein